MRKGRLEAFSDAIIAIIMTIMVLELAAPAGSDLPSLSPLLPKLLTYALSFIFLAIYWVNHHHLFQAVERVNGAVLWANIGLLFWLSLVPFVTAWAGDNAAAPVPVAVYGAVLILAAIAYFILVRTLPPCIQPGLPCPMPSGTISKARSQWLSTQWQSEARSYLPWLGGLSTSSWR